jgi:hypothetical protein
MCLLLVLPIAGTPSVLIDFQAAKSSTLSDSFFQNVILENSSPKPSDLVLRFVIIQYIGFAPRVILVCGSRQPKEGRLDGKSAATFCSGNN